MIERTGWLLDLYSDDRDGVVLWLISESGERLRLHQPFPVTFHLAGPAERLRAAWRWLENQPYGVKLSRSEGRDLFQPDPVTLLSVQVPKASDQPRLFQETAQAFPDLAFYDADIQLALRYAAVHNTFPLAYCRVVYEPPKGSTDLLQTGGLLTNIEVLDSPWTLDPKPAPLRVLALEPDCDPQHHEPKALKIRYEQHEYELSLSPARPMLINLRAILERFDPDILITAWGDTWLLPHLLDDAQRLHLPLPLNREEGRGMGYRKARSYFTYGQIVYNGQQLHLYGRCHLDRRNTGLWSDYEMDGILENARVTALPIQTAARTSPGTGISSMQILTAMRHGILVPWHKQQAERPKTALDLLKYDQGGLIYQPTVGLHTDVGEIDFISMYPSIMVRCNISPEKPLPTDLGSDEEPGLIPLTLAPLLEKRVSIKYALGTMPSWDPRYTRYKAASSAHKWLLVTCFGYLGYKNARFGRIESHESVTTWGREALLRAKEAAEDLGFTILHMYVDGLWVKKEGVSRPEQFQPVLEEIARRTGLAVALDGVYRWVTFLPSRVDSRVPVPNRYFGFFQDGSFKIRGIETRRRDTPAFISEVQMQMLDVLGQAETAEELPEALPRALALMRRRINELRAGWVPLEKLVMGQKLSRELDAYKDPSPSARALMQLHEAGKDMRPGQRVKFLLVRSGAGVHAWDLPEKPDPRSLDVERYVELMLRAAGSVLQPLGYDTPRLREWLAGAESEELPLEVGYRLLLPERVEVVPAVT